ncbi:hypothetical protein Hanom_Chr14g01264161 [Helianthus anomalus]
MVLVNLPMSSGCNTTPIVNLADTSFLFSKLHNKFIVEGCGTAEISSHGNMLTRCSTICSQESGSVKRSYCNWINCCQTSIPYYMDMYKTRSSSSFSLFKTGLSLSKTPHRINFCSRVGGGGWVFVGVWLGLGWAATEWLWWWRWEGGG